MQRNWKQNTNRKLEYDIFSNPMTGLNFKFSMCNLQKAQMLEVTTSIRNWDFVYVLGSRNLSSKNLKVTEE